MTGPCWCNTDLIYPGRYCITHQPPSPIQVVGGGGSEKGEIQISDWLGGMWSARPGELSLVEDWSLAPFPLQESVEITGVDILRTSPPTVGDQH